VPLFHAVVSWYNLRVIRENLKILEERLEAACVRSGRRREELRLMAVSKTQPLERIQEAYDAGLRLFGENRVFEAAEKFSGRFPEAELHLIGHIQRNKAQKAVEIAECIQSLDAVRTAKALDSHAARIDRKISVLIEVNTGGEDSKQGIREEKDLHTLVDSIMACRNLELRGLMTMAPFIDDTNIIRKCFRSLHAIRHKCAESYGAGYFDVLSMGMTNDFEIAVEEGSTLVRIGTALFGAR